MPTRARTYRLLVLTLVAVLFSGGVAPAWGAVCGMDRAHAAHCCKDDAHPQDHGHQGHTPASGAHASIEEAMSPCACGFSEAPAAALPGSEDFPFLLRSEFSSAAFLSSTRSGDALTASDSWQPFHPTEQIPSASRDRYILFAALLI